MAALPVGVPVCCAIANDDAPTANAAAMASVLIVDIDGNGIPGPIGSLNAILQSRFEHIRSKKD